MSVWDRSDWTKGFPFTPTRLAPLGRGIRGQGGQIDVNGPHLQTEGTAPMPMQRARAADRVAGPQALSVRVAPASHRFGPRQASLRLLPAGAFTWGGRAVPVQPRTRPDHVLIWVSDGRMRIDFPRSGGILAAGDVRFVPAGTAFAARSPDHRTLGCYLNMLSLHLSRLDPQRDHRTDPGAVHTDRPLVDRFLALAAVEMGSCRTLADLAQDLGTTLTHLDHACIEARGHRAINQLHELRVDRAAELLRHTDRPVPRLAQDLGYASHAHFTRAFAAATGRTPEAYRSQMRNAPP